MSRSIRKAETGAFQQSYHYDKATRDRWNVTYTHLANLVNIRKIQHKEMKAGMYQVGHPLWQKVQ